jgi:DNA-binding transcriptional ArsR family regulator
MTMLDLEVLDDPDTAALAMEPVKARILAALATPASASCIAAQVGLTRQKVTYHLRALEAHALVRCVEERLWGGLTERVMQASATSYVVSPLALGPIAATPARDGDRYSASYLIALAARMVREVGQLWRGARRSDKRLATLSIDAVVSFASPQARADFTSDLTEAIAGLVARYHDASSTSARPHRLVVASYPAPRATPQQD